MARRRPLADDQVVIRDRRIDRDWGKAHNGTKLCCRVKKGKKRSVAGILTFQSGLA